MKLVIKPAEKWMSVEEFYADKIYHDERKNHLEYFKAHLLKIDKENYVLINENRRLQEKKKNFDWK